MSSIPIRFIPKSSEKSTDSTVHLLPFHIHYTGPAAISSNFIRRPTSLAECTEEASFRGRAMLSTILRVPDAYSGLVVRVDQPAALPTISRASIVTTQKRKATVVISSAEGVKKRRMSPRKAVQRVRERKQFSMDSDEEEEQPEQEMEAMPGVPMIVVVDATQEDVGPVMEDVIQVETVVETSVIEEQVEVVQQAEVMHQTDTMEQQIEEPTAKSTVDLNPVAGFSSISLWNPDGPLDKGADVYWKAVNEWTGLARLVSILLGLKSSHSCWRLDPLLVDLYLLLPWFASVLHGTDMA